LSVSVSVSRTTVVAEKYPLAIAVTLPGVDGELLPLSLLCLDDDEPILKRFLHLLLALLALTPVVNGVLLPLDGGGVVDDGVAGTLDGRRPLPEKEPPPPTPPPPDERGDAAKGVC
jgi:hypothetical protein